MKDTARSAHMGGMNRTPDPRAEGISTNDYCRLLPRRRHTTDALGMLLFLPRTGLVVVPSVPHKGGWTVVVILGNDSYPRGGHNLSVCDAEIETAIELSVGEPVPTAFVNNREEADQLPDGDGILTRTRGYLRKKTVDGRVQWSALLKEPVGTDGLGDNEFPATIISAPTQRTRAR